MLHDNNKGVDQPVNVTVWPAISAFVFRCLERIVAKHATQKPSIF